MPRTLKHCLEDTREQLHQANDRIAAALKLAWCDKWYGKTCAEMNAQKSVVPDCFGCRIRKALEGG